MDFLYKVKETQKQLIADLQSLCQIDTVLIENLSDVQAPFGEGIKQALDWVLALGKSMGFSVLNVDNIAGHIEMGEGEDIMGILCHIDVVPTGEGWTYPPFSATIEGDKLFARGAMDDKGPLISTLYAMKIIKDLGIPLKKRVRLIIGTDEETSWRCVKRYFEVCEMPSIGFSPDAEFPLIYGEKGIMSLDLQTTFKDDFIVSISSGDRYNVVPDYAEAIVNGDVSQTFEKFCQEHHINGKVMNAHGQQKIMVYGKRAHAMEPNKGKNALIALCCFLKTYTSHPLILFVDKYLSDSRFKNIGLNYTHQKMGDLTLNVALIKKVAQKDMIGLNLRYPIGWDKNKFIEAFSSKAKEFGINVVVSQDQGPHYVPKDSKLVQALHNAYIKYTNDATSPLKTIGGGTYARALKNAVAFGMLMPNREEVVHEIDEYLHISDLLVATAIYAQAIYDLGFALCD